MITGGKEGAEEHDKYYLQNHCQRSNTDKKKKKMVESRLTKTKS